MADNKPRDGVKPYVPVIVAIIVTFGATFGANSLLVHNATVEVDAPDRYTGTQAIADREWVEARLDALGNEITQLRRDLDKLPPRALTDRVLKLELELKELRRIVEANH